MRMEIEVGDIVNVFYRDGDCLMGARVLKKPDKFGDLWHFGFDGDLYLQNPRSSNLDTICKREIDYFEE